MTRPTDKEALDAIDVVRSWLILRFEDTAHTQGEATRASVRCYRCAAPASLGVGSGHTPGPRFCGIVCRDLWDASCARVRNVRPRAFLEQPHSIEGLGAVWRQLIDLSSRVTLGHRKVIDVFVKEKGVSQETQALIRALTGSQ